MAKKWLLLQWTVDHSLTVVPESAIKSGEKIVGSEVEALFKKKRYKATVLEIGKLTNLLFSILGTLDS